MESLYSGYINADRNDHKLTLEMFIQLSLSARFPLRIFILFVIILYLLPDHPYDLVTYAEMYTLVTICFLPVCFVAYY